MEFYDDLLDLVMLHDTSGKELEKQ